MPTSARVCVILAMKDLRQRLRDRSVLLLAIVVPLALAFILNLVFGNAGTPSPFRYGIVDLDGGTISTTFTRDVLGALTKQKVITVRKVLTADEARRLVDTGKLDAAFVLPSGFSTASTTVAPTRIEVLGNVRATTATAVARSIAESFATDLNGVRVAVAAGVTRPDPSATGTPTATQTASAAEAAAAAAQRAVAAAQPIRLVDATARTKILDGTTYLAAGMAVFFLFFTVQFGVSSLISERTDGTLVRLLACPIRPATILVSKLLTSIAVGAISMSVLICATTLLMGSAFGALTGVALLVCAVVLAATGITALVASFAKTAEQAAAWQAIVATILGLLGGTFFPVSQVSGLSLVVLITPHAWFMRGLAELAGGGGIGSVFPAVGALLAFALISGGIGFARLRKVVAL